MVDNIAAISAIAITPDQLGPYVAAVSGLESKLIGQCVLHYGGGQGVLVAYDPHNPTSQTSMNEAVEQALRFPGLERLTVLGPERPQQTPVDAAGQADAYWKLDLPLAGQSLKLRNMLKRAAREITISLASGPGCWLSEHAALAREFCNRKKDSLDEGTCFLFDRLGNYLDVARDAALFSAYDKNGALAAFAIGDYTSFSTAFYMFAARAEAATPGTADLLLDALIKEAQARGHARVNLGLGINPGVEFFKKKWGAQPFLPYIETSWDLPRAPAKKGLFARLFGR